MRFIAGLTNFKGFSDDILISLLSEECDKGRRITIDCLHFLFEGRESTSVEFSLRGLL